MKDEEQKPRIDAFILTVIAFACIAGFCLTVRLKKFYHIPTGYQIFFLIFFFFVVFYSAICAYKSET